MPQLVKGMWFPISDRFMVDELRADGTYQIDNLMAALRHVTNFDCAIDGGAHIGAWSRVMSAHFARVIAVEPSADTFEALTWNIEQFGCANVECRNVALGDATGHVTMALDPDQAARANTGARFVEAGGSIPVETIDSWNLPSLGFLKLDVEGSEPHALRGAVETLKRCRPIVLFESKFLWTRHYGLPKNIVAKFLEGLGYRMLEQVSRDQIWGFRR
ncbi:MAG TPA: FkbM family methyltransferase [Vicinamibacterales bacterium]